MDGLLLTDKLDDNLGKYKISVELSSEDKR